MSLKGLWSVCILSLLGAITAQAAVVKDNSFLIEEAYNQEPGVVQFIQTYQYLDPVHEWGYSFTNEIPVPDETHQFSYVIPVAKKNSGTDDQTQVGDVLLNYRYQLMNTEMISIAPRFSLIVPTGDYKKGFGNGVVGFQFNQAISIALNEKWTNHWNAGFTYTPDAKNSLGETASLFGFNFGTSVIYNVTPKTNLICEFVMNNNENVAAQDTKGSSSTYYVVPGIRSAFAVGEETEVVPGIAAMLGAGPSAEQHERGVFLYLSIESKLW
ncbi:transporter [Bdellovibrio sp.]|uniref:transporter n=1 Tax=Bdellovibrio sp. TaxID=28201 RepID=UPI0039E3CDC0